MLNRWGFVPKVLGYIPNVRGAITGLPESATPSVGAAYTTQSFSSPPTIHTAEPCVSRVLLPAPWAQARPAGGRYWRRG